MLTLSSAARLLTNACDARTITALAHALGFTGEPAPLDADARSALGLPAFARRCAVLEGRGILRALCVLAPAGTLTREAVVSLTQKLQRRSPFALWLVLVAEKAPGTALAIAAGTSDAGPRTSYLLLDRTRVVDSDAETVRALASAGDGLDLLAHARWCEVLGREALTNRFFRALEGTVQRLADSIDVRPDDARTLALLTSTRLLFLAFLEAKGWLDGDHGFLRRTWDSCMAVRGGYHRRVLDPLCFGTLNTPRSQRAPAARGFGSIPFLNGGLFNRTPLERRHRRALFPDDALGTLVCDLLGGWRFTVREQAVSHAEAAVDPEMLGRAFESLMASRDRRASGTFYTPRQLVTRVFDAALEAECDHRSLVPGLRSLRAGDEIGGADAARLGDRLSALRILDPACGSGAFLVHALEELSSLRSQCGDPRDMGVLRRDVLARQLFGVDRAPTAVWLCELRLWLAVVVETVATDPHTVPPLPNLDAHIRIGDALSGDAFVRTRDFPASPLGRLRERYARATGARKRTLAHALTRSERTAAVAALDARLAAVAEQRRDIVSALRGRDLFGARVRPDPAMRERLDALRRNARELRAERTSLARGGAVPFDFAAQFADVGACGGFDMVIGNPPWVRLHRIPAGERVRLRERFLTYRDAGWRAGAALAGAGSGFAAQVDLSALFVERSLALTRPGGTISLLVPAKLWRSLAGAGVRSLLTRSACVRELEDWSEARATFDAAVYPSLVVASHDAPTSDAPVQLAEHHRDRALRWSVPRGALAYDESPGAPWLWLPAEPRAGFDRVRALGIPLAEHAGLRPRLGVKCGCNEAFVLGPTLATSIEPSLVRPLLRGERVTPWRIASGDECIVFPHDATLRPLRDLPPCAKRHLLRFRVRLAARSDCRGRMPWWSLFRVDAAAAHVPRVVWADLSRTPRAAVLPAGDTTVPLNSCYVVHTTTLDEAHALAAWLNSPLAAAWLAMLAEPARGGYRRLLGWTVSLLPIPRDWERAVAQLAPLGARGAAGDAPPQDELLDAALNALGATHADVEALLTWGHR